MEDTTKKFLDAAIGRGWVTREQVDEVLRIQQTMLEVGVSQKVEDLLVRKGYLDEEKADRLRRDVAGLRIGKYTILERLGEGGAGVVYKAVQEPLERVVAIKLLSRARVSSAEYLERFRREARVAVTLNHQNIVRGLDYGEADGYHFFVMEFVEGETLQQIITREGMLDEKRAFTIALQITEALQHATSFALVHRDIKPENILMTVDGAPKLCDMGLAKPSMFETAEAVKSGTTIGTPLYMSPEQILGKEEADFRSDIYSLGVALFEMVTGQRPFSGATVDEIVRKQLRETPKDPRELNLKLSASGAMVILKMLAKRPDDRYPDLADLHEDLRAVLDGRPPRHAIQVGRKKSAAPVRIEVEDGAVRRARREKKKAPVVPIAIGAALLGAAAAAFFVLNPLDRKPSPPPVTVGGTTTVVPSPGPEDRARELLEAARAYEVENPGAPFGAKRDRYQFVIDNHPFSRFAMDAKDRIRQLTEAKAAGEEEHREFARKAFEGLVDHANPLLLQRQYAKAAALFDAYPAGFTDTEWPDRARQEAERIRAEAEAAAKVALEDADVKLRRGDFAGADAALDGLAPFGLLTVESAVKEKRAEIAAAREEEEKERRGAESYFRTVLGAAFVRAARGEWDGAEEDIVRAGEEEVLAPLRQDLDQAFRDLREAQRFESALKGGARKLEGKAEKFGLLYPWGGEVSGRVAAVESEGIRVSRGPREELVPFGNLAPRDRLRIAFLVLDLGLPDDHRSAAIYFMVHGLFPDAEAEIEAARIAGLDPARLMARKEMLAAYARERADGEVRKAEILLTQKRPQDARRLLVAAVAATPAHAKLRFTLGCVLLALGQPGEAVPELQSAAELGLSDPALSLRLGQALAGADRPEEAVEQLEKYRTAAEKDDPELANAEKLLASLRESALAGRMKELEDQMKMAYRRKDVEKTMKLAGDLLRLNPANEEGLYHLAKARVDAGLVLEGYFAVLDYLERAPSAKRAAEVRRLQKNLEKDHAPNMRSMELNQKGRIDLEGRQYQPALTLFTSAIEASRLNAEAYYNRGRAHLSLGEQSRDPAEFAAARDDFAASVRLLPEKGPSYEGLGLAYYYLEEYEKALEAARKAIAAMPDRWPSYSVVGLVYYVRSDYEVALAWFDKGIAVAPDEPQLDIDKAFALERLLRKDEAIAVLRAALRKKVSEANINAINEILKRLEE
jgi:serine/threonine-protein kinase